MDDKGRHEEIARLHRQLDDAQAKRAALLDEVIHLTAHIPEIRRAFGNPFFYSHPEEPDEGIVNYTGTSSHGVGFSTLVAWRRAEREIGSLKEQLRQLGVDPA